MIDVNREKMYAANFGDNATQIRRIKSDVNGVKTDLNSQWKGKEMSLVNQAFDKLSADLLKISTMFNNLENTIKSEANRIYQKELLELRAKQEAEAKAREEAEAKAKAKALSKGTQTVK